MMWALMGAVLLGMVGLTVDFTRAQAIRNQMQNAADGAALAAARGDTATPAQREAAARSFFEAEMGEMADQTTLTIEEAPDGEIIVGAAIPMPVTLARLVNANDWTLRVRSHAERSGNNIEIALVLDVTGSMSGSRISALRTAASNLVNAVVSDEQTPYYSKVALAPYSMGVNAGAYAAEARGAIAGAVSMGAAAWRNGNPRNISGITRANPAVVTANSHGLANGDYVFIRNVSGMTQVNNRVFQVSNVTTNTFRLNVSSSGFSSYSSGGTVTRCLNSTCSVQVTANGHGFAVNDRVYFTGVNGMTQLNNTLFTISVVNNSNVFTLSGTHGTFSDYTSSGSVFCTVANCEYYAYTTSSGATRVNRVSTCVSERTGAQAYTDAAPTVSRVGLIYPTSTNPCPGAAILPLSTDRATINARIASFTAAGSTAGHIGLAWGFYLLSPEWGYMFPAASRGASYDAPETLKIAVLMTDGEFNTAYCNHVYSRNYSGGVGSSERINCDATNGSPFTQALELCDEIKDQGIIIYTVGLELGSNATVVDMMRRCATSGSHAYLSGNTMELVEAFDAIANSITQLRLTH